MEVEDRLAQLPELMEYLALAYYFHKYSHYVCVCIYPHVHVYIYTDQA